MNWEVIIINSFIAWTNSDMANTINFLISIAGFFVSLLTLYYAKNIKFKVQTAVSRKLLVEEYPELSTDLSSFEKELDLHAEDMDTNKDVYHKIKSCMLRIQHRYHVYEVPSIASCIDEILIITSNYQFDNIENLSASLIVLNEQLNKETYDNDKL